MFASMGVYSRSDDWLFVLIVLALCYLILYPLKLLHYRFSHSRRIRNNLVTTAYKLPVKLTPVELSYLFSTRVGYQQMYATLRDLVNRSVITMRIEKGTTLVGIGPKLDNTLHSFEKMLVGYIHQAEHEIDIDRVITGNADYRLANREAVKGSKQYVFWWLLRDSLQKRGIINAKMNGKYTTMLVKFGLIGGLLLSVIPLALARTYTMINLGEVSFHLLADHILNGITAWLLFLFPLLIVSYLLLRLSGRMMGRRWLLTTKFYRYLGQLEAYREFVRLTHKNKLRFESKALEKDSIAETKPYAISLRYIKD